MDIRREKEEIRKRRADIDAEILSLLVKRAQLSKQWAASHAGEVATLPSTERQTLEELSSGNLGALPREAVESIFREIHATCRALEAPVRVAFVGVPGGHGYVAARGQFGPSASYAPVESASAAVADVEAKRADFAVLPYETAAEGPVNPTLVALRRSDLKIIAVHPVDAPLCLLSRTGNPQDVEKVYATASDRAAVSGALAALAPKAVILDVRSPLVACQLAAEDHGAAALALEPVGRALDLSVIGQLAADEARARFCVASSRPATRSGRDVTTLLFSVSDEPGALFEVLKHFAERGVNLRKIHSWPGDAEWGYVFFLEISGHVTDRALVTALEGMKQRTKMLKILGSHSV